jgi:molybdate transport system ATP-binding protein
MGSTAEHERVVALSAALTVRRAPTGRPTLEVDLAFGPGVTAVMGPSGAGKSTLLCALAGLLRPERARIVLGGRVLTDDAKAVFVPPHERSIAMVFQSLALFPHMSVLRNVAYGIDGRSAAARDTLAREWLERAKVGHLADRAPSSLSGGEAQRVAIARALASAPALLLLDEPFSALDRPLRAQLCATIGAMLSESPVPTILVTHDAPDAAQLASRVIELDAGRVVDDRALTAASSR